MTDPTAPGPLAATAALLADPARARMLAALMSGEALTAGELARVAGVTAATASGHLARLAEGGLVLVHAQGRHRYHRLASEEVAAAIEALGGLAARIAPARVWRHGEEARRARLCWNHLAGRLGVALHARLTGQGWLTPVPGGWDTTDEGRARLARPGWTSPAPPPPRASPAIAWTGPNAARIWPAAWGGRSLPPGSPAAGCAACRRGRTATSLPAAAWP